METTKHARLATDLRQQIQSGVLVGEVPTEAELIDSSGFGRSTVRQALTALENEGLITSAQGSRRRVRKQRRWVWPMTTWERLAAHTSREDAWAAGIREQGGVPSAEVSVLVDTADDGVAAALEVESGEQVVLRRRVRMVDGEPHQLADSYFPSWLAKEHPVFLEPGDKSAPGGLLAAAGLPQARLLDRLTARMPSPEEARKLAMSRGVPLIVHSRVGYGADDRPLRYMVTLMAADRVDLHYELVP